MRRLIFKPIWGCNPHSGWLCFTHKLMCFPHNQGQWKFQAGKWHCSSLKPLLNTQCVMVQLRGTECHTSSQTQAAHVLCACACSKAWNEAYKYIWQVSKQAWNWPPNSFFKNKLITINLLYNCECVVPMAAWVISQNPLTVQIVRLSVDSELPVGLNEKSKCL